ncbi:MAG: glycosyltransferase [Pseudomonadota bacterium]
MNAVLPAVSVCIANYNGMALIDDCIRSVLQQDCRFAFEIIIHDDASDDGSARYIREHYPDIVLIDSADNAGFCIANNRMAKLARGKYLLLLNNDAALFPDALRILHEAAEASAVPTILGLPQYDAATGALIDIGSVLDPFLNPIPNLDRGLKDVGMVIGACLWLPRTLWNELGGFPEWFGSLAEDMYLCCLARLWGYRVEALPQSGYRHWAGLSFGGGKVVANRLTTSVRRRALSERNKTFVMMLTYPAPLLQVLLPLHLAILGLEGIVLALMKRDGRLWRDIYFACFRAVWRQWTHVLRLRRQAQRRRRASVRAFIAPFRFYPHKLLLLVRHGIPAVR